LFGFRRNTNALYQETSNDDNNDMSELDPTADLFGKNININ